MTLFRKRIKKSAKEIIHDLIREENKTLKEDIKELKKQVGYWVCDGEGVFLFFTVNKPAKPEFSVSEKVEAILEHLGMEMKKVEKEAKITVVPKKKERKTITYVKRGMTIKEKK